MHIRNILLASLFVSLYGCQPDAPAPKASAPAAVEPAPAPPPSPAVQAVQPLADEAAAIPKVEPSPSAKAALPATTEKAAAAKKERSPQPAVVEQPASPTDRVSDRVIDAPPAKAEPPPAAVVPEVQPEPAVSEADAMQLAKKSNCLACHAADKKIVGPSFKDIAAKYRGDAGAEARLANVIAKGSKGVWGAMAMPPSPQISEANREILAKFVLSLK